MKPPLFMLSPASPLFQLHVMDSLWWSAAVPPQAQPLSTPCNGFMAKRKQQPKEAPPLEARQDFQLHVMDSENDTSRYRPSHNNSFQLHVMDSRIFRQVRGHNRHTLEVRPILSTPCNGFGSTSYCSIWIFSHFQLHVMDSSRKDIRGYIRGYITFNSM